MFYVKKKEEEKMLESSTANFKEALLVKLLVKQFCFLPGGLQIVYVYGIKLSNA